MWPDHRHAYNLVPCAGAGVAGPAEQEKEQELEEPPKFLIHIMVTDSDWEEHEPFFMDLFQDETEARAMFDEFTCKNRLCEPWQFMTGFAKKKIHDVLNDLNHPYGELASITYTLLGMVG